MQVKGFVIRQDMRFVWFPVGLNVILLVSSIVVGGIVGILGVVFSLILSWMIIRQSKFMFINNRMEVSKDGVKIYNFRGSLNKKINWKNVVGVAIGEKKTWKMWVYNFYFRMKGEEDVSAVFVTFFPELGVRFKNFVRIFVRHRIPVQVVRE
jgi:hypothetical protein